MKFIKPFRGVPAREIYPVEYQPGEECPEELLSAAVELGAVDAAKDQGAKSTTKAKSK